MVGAGEGRVVGPVDGRVVGAVVGSGVSDLSHTDTRANANEYTLGRRALPSTLPLFVKKRSWHDAEATHQVHVVSMLARIVSRPSMASPALLSLEGPKHPITKGKFATVASVVM